MFIDKNSIQIKVGNGSYVNMGQYLVEAKYGFNKLWSSDSGRSLSGQMSGTLIGVFPKLTLQFRKLTKAELEVIVPLLDAPRQTVKYYDPNKKQNVEMTTYSSDYEITNRYIIGNNRKNLGFSCSFISTKKRV